MKVILNAAYNVFFHPLSKFPGCKLHAATRFVKDVKLLRGTFSESAKDLHLKYGEIVRVAPNELSYIDRKSCSTFHGVEHAAKAKCE